MLNLNYLWIMLKTVSSVTIFSGKILKKIWQPLHETKKQWVGVLLLELIVYLQNWPDMLDFSSQSSSIHSLPRPSRGHMYMSTKKKEQCVHSHTMSTCAWVKPPQHIQSAEIAPAPLVGPRTHAYCTRQDMNICGACALCRSSNTLWSTAGGN